MNLSYIDWYLVEIRRHLHGSLPLDRLNSFEFETRNHLESQTEDFVTQGMDQKSAQIAAIERFGTPGDIAEQCLIQGKRSISNTSRTVLGLGFVVFVFATLFNQLSYIHGFPNSYVTGSNSNWLIFGFAVFAFLVKRIPRVGWFLLPPVAIVGLGTACGYFSTFYAPMSNSPVPPMSYASLHHRYLVLRDEQSGFTKVEHEAAKYWREVMVKAKDLGPNDTLLIPRIVYEMRRGQAIYYPTFVGSDGGSIATSGESTSATIVSETNQFAFQYMPVRKVLTLHGPLTSKEIRTVVSYRISEVEHRNKWRDTVLAGMQKSLNIPVTTRIWTVIGSQLTNYLFVVAPISFCVCFLATRIRGRVRVKTSKMKLA